MTKDLAFSSAGGCQMDAWIVSDILQWAHICLNSSPKDASGDMGGDVFVTFMQYSLYNIWSLRNEALPLGSSMSGCN